MNWPGIAAADSSSAAIRLGLVNLQCLFHQRPDLFPPERRLILVTGIGAAWNTAALDFQKLAGGHPLGPGPENGSTLKKGMDVNIAAGGRWPDCPTLPHEAKVIT